MVVGDSLDFSSIVAGPRESQAVFGNSVLGAAPVSGEGSDGLDAGSADLGFVASSAMVSVLEGLGSEKSVSLISGSAAVSVNQVLLSAVGSAVDVSALAASASSGSLDAASGLVSEAEVVSDVIKFGSAVVGTGLPEVSNSIPSLVLAQSVSLSLDPGQVSGAEVAPSGLVSERSAVGSGQGSVGLVSSAGLALVSAQSLVSDVSGSFPAVVGSVSATDGLGLVDASELKKSSVGSAAERGSDLTLRNTGVISEQSLANGKGVEITKKSYLSAVQQKSSLSKHNLSVVSEGGVQVVQVPDDILNNVQHLWDDLIIGKFPDDSPHIAKVHVIVNKIWAYGNKLSKIDAFVVNKSTIKFRIKDPIIRDRVLRRGMWNIADKPMIVSKYGPIDDEDLSAPRTMSLWVTLTEIPPAYYSWKGLSFLSSVIGEPKRLHPETELCNKFDEAKVFIEVDLTKPLPDSFSFKSRSGVISEVKYSYPWLPPRCCACGKWGHLIDVCRTVTILKRNSPVLDPPQPVGIDTDAGGGVASPLSVTETKSGNSHSTTKDFAAAPATVKNISATGIKSPSRLPSSNQHNPALSHPVCQDSDVGDSGGTPRCVSRETQGDTEGWSLVSPKKSHQAQQITLDVLDIGSPSRYSVLAGQEEMDTPAEFDKLTEVPTEVSRDPPTDFNKTVATGSQQLGEKKIETTLRPSLPRQSKTARKNNSTASNLSQKGEVSKKITN